MVSLRQKELAEWQRRNFGDVPSERLALGIAEEVGELCHALLKRKQGIREASDGNNLKPEIADAFADCVIFGINLLSAEGLDAELVLRQTIKKVLQRDWVNSPEKGE